MRNPWVSALVSAAAALAVAVPVLAGGAAAARLALAIGAGLVAALVAGGLFARPAFRALDRWRRAGDDIVRRLLGSGAEETSAPDPARRFGSLSAPSRGESLEESISDLARPRLEAAHELRHAVHLRLELVGAATGDCARLPTARGVPLEQ